MARKPGQLTPKQERFVQEYLIDLNATQAAIRAGYAERSAQVQSSRLLSNDMVAAAIEAGQAKTAHRLACTADDVLERYRQFAFGEVFDARPTDQLHALDSLSKHMGLFKADNDQSKTVLQIPRCSDLETRLQALEEQTGGKG